MAYFNLNKPHIQAEKLTSSICNINIFFLKVQYRIYHQYLKLQAEKEVVKKQLCLQGKSI